MLELFCIHGGIPSVFQYGDSKRDVNTRLQLAMFSKTLCESSADSRRIFISCRGIAMLAEFFDNFELACIAVECIASILKQEVVDTQF
jgi:hypothetical protein